MLGSFLYESSVLLLLRQNILFGEKKEKTTWNSTGNPGSSREIKNDFRACSVAETDAWTLVPQKIYTSNWSISVYNVIFQVIWNCKTTLSNCDWFVFMTCAASSCCLHKIFFSYSTFHFRQEKQVKVLNLLTISKRITKYFFIILWCDEICVMKTMWMANKILTIHVKLLKTCTWKIQL